MKLSELMEKSGKFGSLDITGVTCDSRHIVPRCAFVCINGAKSDGHDFAANAIESGAAVIIAERDLGIDNQIVLENLKFIAAAGVADKCLIRIPLIPGYNTEEDRDNSMAILCDMGFARFDKFEYKTEIKK